MVNWRPGILINPHVFGQRLLQLRTGYNARATVLIFPVQQALEEQNDTIVPQFKQLLHSDSFVSRCLSFLCSMRPFAITQVRCFSTKKLTKIKAEERNQTEKQSVLLPFSGQKLKLVFAARALSFDEASGDAVLRPGLPEHHRRHRAVEILAKLYNSLAMLEMSETYGKETGMMYKTAKNHDNVWTSRPPGATANIGPAASGCLARAARSRRRL